MCNKKKGKFPVKLADQILWNKLCLYLIDPCKILIEIKCPLELKTVTMIDPVTWCFLITQYNKKNVINIANLVEKMWITRYPWPIEITFDQ